MYSQHCFNAVFSANLLFFLSADHVIDNNGSESDLLNVALKTKKYIIDVERFGMEWVWGFMGLLKSFGYV